MLYDKFHHVRTWVFDLDNTLYPYDSGIFDQMDGLIQSYICDVLNVTQQEADRLRMHYYNTHGATFIGLQRHHDLDPGPFLEAIHDLDLSVLPADPALRQAIADLPGRKVVFTNGTRDHAHRVTQARGLSDVFDDLYGIEDAGFMLKPMAAAYDAVFSLANVEATQSAMFDDVSVNLIEPHKRGLQTVLVGSTAPAHHHTAETTDLTGFLSRLTG